MRKDVPEKTSLHQGRTELMGTGVPEVIVLEARAALGTLRASERKKENENILISILGLIKTCGYGGDLEDVFLCCRLLQLEERLGIKPSGARVA